MHVGSLRGNEGIVLDLHGGLHLYSNEGTKMLHDKMAHVVAPLLGYIKNELGEH